MVECKLPNFTAERDEGLLKRCFFSRLFPVRTCKISAHRGEQQKRSKGPMHVSHSLVRRTGLLGTLAMAT
jgi:hypothetical protein